MHLSERSRSSSVVGGLVGHLVGDALGVPVEFKSRAARHHDPVTDMRGYGTYNQPPGTWSDDDSLTLGTAEALLGGFDLARVADSFVRWRGSRRSATWLAAWQRQASRADSWQQPCALRSTTSLPQL
jgi:ADP-ribosylglycohydrolase